MTEYIITAVIASLLLALIYRLDKIYPRKFIFEQHNKNAWKGRQSWSGLFYHSIGEFKSFEGIQAYLKAVLRGNPHIKVTLLIHETQDFS